MAGKKLLVIDDSLTIQKVIRLALSNEGYEIQACSDGNDAIQQISLFRPDVILIDVSLPGKTAFEIKNEVNQQADVRHPKFILMASAFEQVDEVQVTSSGFQSRLIKPFDPAHLRQVIIEALQGSSSDMIEEPEVTPPQTPNESVTLQDDLWGKESKLKAEKNRPEPMLPPAYFDAPMEMAHSEDAEPSEESDIRQLTESTIKMSGLDEYNWSVNESAKISEAPAHRFNPDRSPEKMNDCYGDLPLTPPPKEEMKIEHNQVTGASASPQVSAISTGDVENAVKKHLQSTLEQMAQKMLPEIAERVIKEHIHKILSENS